jgi:hypothetical protein
MTMPHRNYADRTVYPTRRDEARLAIRESGVFDYRVTSREQFSRVGEIKPALLKRRSSLHGVEDDFHH